VITRIAKLRYLRIAAFAIGGVAVAGAAVLVTASAAGLNVGFRAPLSNARQADSTAMTPGSGKVSAICSDVVTHFAGDLGSTQAKVNAAFQKAVGQTLADEVKNGDLTQAQADSIQQKLAGQAPCSLAAGLGKPSAAARSKIAAYLPQLESAAASGIGISDTQMKIDLAQGMTLSQIAAAQKPPVTEAQFRTRLIANLTPLLDAAVKNQQLTAAQETAILQRLQAGPIPFWSTPMHGAGAATPASPPAST
jgi:hypothetical protein